MKKAKDLSCTERLEIGILLEKGYSKRSIARVLDRGHNTISYEIKENSVKGKYDPLKAHAKAHLRKRMRKSQWSKIEEDLVLKRFIIEKLKQGWNPDEIAGYMKKHPRQCPVYVSKTAIYEWLRTARGERYCKYLYSKRKYVKKRKTKHKKVLIPNRVGIEQRSVGIINRSRFGHWEDDAIVSGKQGKGCLSVSSERKSKLVKITKCNTMSPKEHIKAHRKIVLECKVLSKTYDNGIENIYHEELHSLGVKTYFCDAYSSWQKGGVENVNKIIRRYIPKGTNISKVPEEYIQFVEDRINKKPRKILGYRSALEVAQSAGIIRNIKSESVLIQG